MTHSPDRPVDRAREDRFDDARRERTRAVVLCRKSGSRGDLVRALEALAKVERDAGRRQEAIRLCREAVDLCRSDGEPASVAHAVRHLGDALFESGRRTEAEHHALEALELYRSSDTTRPADMADALRTLGLIREDAARISDAMALWREARGLYASAGVAERIAECDVHLRRLRAHGSSGGPADM